MDLDSVRDNFCRFVASTSLETWGQGGDADGGAVSGFERN